MVFEIFYSQLQELISVLLYDFAIKESKCQHVCGVPYTALPIATLLSVKAKKSMLMRRKEAKSYGTKKVIEGHYCVGDSCLIIEDVITSGSSVMETVNDLRKEGLKADEAIIILDREQGGKQNLENNNVSVKSLFTMSDLIGILVESKKVTEQMGIDVKNYLNNVQAPKSVSLNERILLPYEKRAELTSNPIAKKLFNIMAVKKTNLCISVDLTSSIKILDLIEQIGDHICLVKTHIDIIEDFCDNFITSLTNMAKKFNFLILEDRKFADIGNTIALQYEKGLYKINEWADCVTCHSLPGEGILKAFSSSNEGTNKGIFLLAEMSSEGNLITPEYTQATVKMAEKYSKLITGLVCQKKETFNNPEWIQLTPGVQLESSKDSLGQVYNTPEKVILENGADCVVVGRGIVFAKNPAAEAIVYKDTLWRCYMKRISGKIE
ncbi:unnamed protein product [Leptidea sinapis]|uniref:Orotidine 5'-phosphate decarboxylase n=1 Tax=Leptidea sinapis TaxID=189913 RepID=A0A5E4R3Y0_9NEOP|nr:unnamed protein product [Leptidea sinapis]